MKQKSFFKKLYAGIILALFVILFVSGQYDVALGQEEEVKSTDKKENPVIKTRVLYMTSRDRLKDSSDKEFYGGSRSNLSMGSVEVEFKPIPGLNKIAESTPFYIPGTRINPTGIDEMPESRFFQEIKNAVRPPESSIVIYIHGYNTGFEKACRQTAIFQQALGPGRHVVLFSWPADGDLLKYTKDEADLMWSVPSLADSMIKLIRIAGAGRISIVSHSLGAQGVFLALNRMACEFTDGPQFNNLVFIAPDIDSDSFRAAWPDIQHMAFRTTLYASANDKALKLSQKVHGYPRLGEADEYLMVLSGLETVDVSLIDLRRFSGHVYHLYNPAVINDLTDLINTGSSADKRATLQQADMNGSVFWKVLPVEE